jgi:NADH-quinone oxidoreductase subunit A
MPLPAPSAAAAMPATVDIASYLPVLLLLVMAIGFAVTNLVGSQLIGPKRSGTIKDGTYESGMNPIGTARKRFNVRFYLIAMVFLVFDIEIIFLYPWAVTFPNLDQTEAGGGIWLARILFFMLTTVVAYIYGIRKGVFKFD